MQATQSEVRTERENDARARPPRCPICDGTLVALRTNLQCARCRYSLCDGCAGESAQDCTAVD